MKTLTTFYFIILLFFSIMFGIMTIDAINGFLNHLITSPLLGLTCSKSTLFVCISHLIICIIGTRIVYKIRN